MKKINGKVFILLTLLTMPLFGEKITVQTATEMAIKNNRDIKKECWSWKRADWM